MAKQTSKIDFKIGFKVRIFNSYENMWDVTGQIVLEIPSKDGINKSLPHKRQRWHINMEKF